MSISKVSICNSALRMIGSKIIASFEEETELAQHCRDIYDQTRRALLRDHPWSCARKRTVLAPVVTYPSFGYSHAFPLPHDYILILDANTEQYEVESRHILANAEELRLVYIFDNDNEQTWDALLVEALSTKLASKMCKPITGSDSAGETAEMKYQQLIRRARAINAQERPSQDIQFSESGYIGSRY